MIIASLPLEYKYKEILSSTSWEIDKTPDNEKTNKFLSANEKPGNGVHKPNYVVSYHPTNPSYFVSFLLPAATPPSISPKIRKRDLFLSERQREGQNLLVNNNTTSR